MADSEVCMRPSKSLALALPGVAALALVQRYRNAVERRSASRCDIPTLPGWVRALPTAWGRVSYRYVPGADSGPSLIFVHGWGRSADSVWWRLLAHTKRTVVAVDLPGHGRSTLDTRFSFELAAEAVQVAIEDAGLIRPVLVGHSMGGPVALTVVRGSTPHAFTGFVAMASSAYWIRPRYQLKVAAAPYVLGPNSPVTLRRQRAEERRDPDQARMIAWEYAVRPQRQIMEESAAELRRFDARRWNDFKLPPALWIVTGEDGVISPFDQHSSAIRLGIATVEVPFDHRLTTEAAPRVAGIIETAVEGWSQHLPIGIRPRASRPQPWN